jgi:hypothetical protein
MRFGVLTLSFFLFAFVGSAEAVSLRTGFVDGPVWFSAESLKLDQTVKIYTAVFNGESSMLSVKVDFLDDETVLSTKEINVSPNETKSVSIDWKVSSGEHNIFAKVSSAKVGGETVILERSKTGSVDFSVTKEVPADVVKKALTDKFSNIFEGEGSFLEKADALFKMNFAKSEEWREKKIIDFKASKDKVEKRRLEEKEDKDTKTSVKVISFIHFYFLAICLFIFSTSVLFYILAVILIYLALRTLWRLLRRLFRKKHEE